MEGVLEKKLIPKASPESAPERSRENISGSSEADEAEIAKIESPSFMDKLRDWGKETYEKARNSRTIDFLTKERENAIVTKGGKAVYDTVSSLSGTKAIVDWALFGLSSGLKKIGINTSIKGDVHKYFAENGAERALLGITNQAIELKKKAKSQETDRSELGELAKQYKQAVLKYKTKIDNLNVGKEEKLRLRRELSAIMGDHKRQEASLEKGQSLEFNNVMRQYTGAKIDGFKLGKDALNSALTLSQAWVLRGASHVAFSALSRGKKEWDDYSRRIFEQKKRSGESADWKSSYREISSDKFKQMLKGVTLDSAKETFNELSYGQTGKETGLSKKARSEARLTRKQENSARLEEYKRQLDQEGKGVFGKSWRVARERLKNIDPESLRKNLVRVQALGKVTRLFGLSFVGANAWGEDGILDNLGEKLISDIQEKGLLSTAQDNIFESVQRTGRMFDAEQWKNTLGNIKKGLWDSWGPGQARAEGVDPNAGGGSEARIGDKDKIDYSDTESLRALEAESYKAEISRLNSKQEFGSSEALSAIEKGGKDFQEGGFIRHRLDDVFKGTGLSSRELADDRSELFAPKSEEDVALAIVGKGKGVEHSFINQLKANPKEYGYDPQKHGPSAEKWAGAEAHRIAIKAGYVDGRTGQEVWLKRKAIDNVAYVLHKNQAGELEVVEMVKGTDDNLFRPSDEIHKLSKTYKDSSFEKDLEDYEYKHDRWEAQKAKVGDTMKKAEAIINNGKGTLLGTHDLETGERVWDEYSHKEGDKYYVHSDSGSIVNAPKDRADLWHRDFIQKGIDTKYLDIHEYYMNRPAKEILANDLGYGPQHEVGTPEHFDRIDAEASYEAGLKNLSYDINNYGLEPKENESFGQLLERYYAAKAAGQEMAGTGELKNSADSLSNSLFDENVNINNRIENLKNFVNTNKDNSAELMARDSIVKALLDKGKYDDDMAEQIEQNLKNLNSEFPKERQAAEGYFKELLNAHESDGGVKVEINELRGLAVLNSLEQGELDKLSSAIESNDTSAIIGISGGEVLSFEDGVLEINCPPGSGIENISLNMDEGMATINGREKYVFKGQDKNNRQLESLEDLRKRIKDIIVKYRNSVS